MRKHAKDTGGDGGAGVEVEALDDGGDGTFLDIYILAWKGESAESPAAQTRSLPRRKRLPLNCLGRLQRYFLKY